MKIKVTTSQQCLKEQEEKNKLGICFSKEMQDTYHKDYKILNKTQLNIKYLVFMIQNCDDVI